MDKNSTRLSSRLLSLETVPPYASATRHTFLTQAGTGTLPLSRLAFWLAQDRIYAAHAYPRFIGSLIASIPFSTSDDITSVREHRNAEILRVLVGCLDNIVREIGFFEEAAKKWGLDIDAWHQRKATRDYTAEMARISGQGSLDDGLIFLWAMEKIYLDAWTYVKELQNTYRKRDEGDSHSLAAARGFANNWSSPEFAQFVDILQSLVDSLDIPPNSEKLLRAETIWRRAVELETEFWPGNDEELDP